jgi:hypothetical protein
VENVSISIRGTVWTWATRNTDLCRSCEIPKVNPTTRAFFFQPKRVRLFISFPYFLSLLSLAHRGTIRKKKKGDKMVDGKERD